MPENIDNYKKRSVIWFLLPVFFTLLGGIIAYFAIKSDDPRRAKDCLLLGIILFAIPVIILGVMIAFFSFTLSELEPIFSPPIYEI